MWAPRRLPAQFRGGCARAKTACRKDAVISRRRSAKTAAGIAARAVRGCREAQRECAAAGLARAAGGRRVSRGAGGGEALGKAWGGRWGRAKGRTVKRRVRA